MNIVLVLNSGCATKLSGTFAGGISISSKGISNSSKYDLSRVQGTFWKEESRMPELENRNCLLFLTALRTHDMTTATRTLSCIVLACALCTSTALASFPEFSYHVSNQRINVMAQAPDGFIWFGTAHGLNRHSGENFLTWYASDQPGDLNNDLINDICFDSLGDMWLATECGIIRFSDGAFDNTNDAVNNPVLRVLALPDSTIVASGRDGILKFDLEQNVLERFFVPGSSWLKTLDTDSQGRIWAAVESDGTARLYVLNGELDSLMETELGKGVEISGVCSFGCGQVWVISSKGIDAFDCTGLKRAGKPSASRLVESSDCAFVCPYPMEDKALIGIHGTGMFSYSFEDDSCKHIFPDEKLEGKDYRAFVDRDGNIWLSEYGKQYEVFPRESGCVNHSGFLDAVGADLIRNMAYDSKGRLWMSLENGYAGYDPATRTVLWRKQFRNTFTHLFVDRKDRLWIVTDLNRVERYSLAGNVPVPDKTFSFDSNVNSISEDASGMIWIINNFEFHTIDSLDRMQRIGPIESGGEKLAHTMALTDMVSGRVFVNTVRFGLFECSADGEFTPIQLGKGVSSINSLVTTRDGRMWMGTFNHGLICFNPADGDIRRFNLSTGLSSDSIESVLCDDKGRIWFNTPSHIICYNPSDDSFNTLYDYNFSDADFYSLLCAVRTPDGKIFFGGYGGLTEVDDDIEFDKRGPDIPLNFEYAAINDRQVDPKQSLELDYKSKLLTVMFSGLNFNFGTLLNYSYMLEGFDKDWTLTDRVQISYSNLPPGKYRLRVRVRYLNGQWSSNELSLPVTVHPAPWATTGAKIAYALIAILLLYLLVSGYIRAKMRRSELAMKQEHINFISNVSHELRTPLTLIAVPAAQLHKSPVLGEKELRYVETIERNAERMKMISEEIIDAPNSRRRDETLSVSLVDLSSLARETAGNFNFAAMEKSMTFKTEIGEDIVAWADRYKVEKILVNLMSNAFKYTPEGGTVLLTLSSDGTWAHFSVQDNGMGIPEDKRKQLFNRFERLDADRKRPSVAGSGIGLNYSMSLARLHKGRLEYAPASVGSGSVFSLSIPVSKAAYEESELAEMPLHNPASATGSGKKTFDPSLSTIMIAEDNPEIRALLCDILEADHNVITAGDGAEAWESLKIAIPDAIISDVVMPRKDGYVLCRELKASQDYCHIPVILLTAKRDNASAIRGLDCGADTYIGKPFDPDYLKASVDSLINNRKLIQQRIRSLTSESLSSEASRSSLSEQEMKFLAKVHETIEKHIEEESFSIETMAREIGASYSKLYAKIKSLTGQTPQEFVSTYKMNRAMELLKTGKYNVSEVADLVGASSPFNFSRDFKKHFGITPSSVFKGKQ